MHINFHSCLWGVREGREARGERGAGESTHHYHHFSPGFRNVEIFQRERRFIHTKSSLNDFYWNWISKVKSFANIFDIICAFQKMEGEKWR